MRPQSLAVVLPLFLAAGAARTLAAAEPVRAPNLALERRVDDLVSRLTLDEKAGMPAQMQPAIPRLGIKAFTNWTEGLHGLGWVRGGSVTATTFPQAVGLTRAGDEVVQLYVKHLNSAVARPIEELRGFQRITLRPNKTRTVRLPLKGNDLTYWDAEKRSFVVEAGRVSIMLGASSADARIEKTIEVKEE